MVIGWPQGIFLALQVASICANSKTGKPGHTTGYVIGTLLVDALLVWGGFFGGAA